VKNFNNLESWIKYKNNKEIFNNHIATITKLPTGKNDVYINFKREDTNDGWMDFIYCNGYLTIQGDYGSASFCWYNKNNTIEVLAKFAENLGYFLSKLLSAEKSNINGTLLQDFDGDECIKEVETYFKENELAISKDYKDDWKKNTNDHTEWVTFCRENGADFFQDEDYWDFAYDFGRYTLNKAYLYAYGLIKAVEYLQKNNKDEK